MFHRQQSQRQMSISGCKWPLIILLSFIIRKHILATRHAGSTYIQHKFRSEKEAA